MLAPHSPKPTTTAHLNRRKPHDKMSAMKSKKTTQKKTGSSKTELKDYKIMVGLHRQFGLRKMGTYFRSPQPPEPKEAP